MGWQRWGEMPIQHETGEIGTFVLKIAPTQAKG